MFEPGGAKHSLSGAVTLTTGEETARLPARTELDPVRLQEGAESDLEDGWMLFEGRLPREVPPLMTVVELGVGGSAGLS